MGTDQILSRISEYLRFDPKTGAFVWIKGMRGIAANTPAGSKGVNGHIYIRFRGTKFLAHRLAILFTTGQMPPANFDVDHIDGNPSNNAIANLRVVTHAVNSQNRVRANRRITGRSSKFLGVSWKKDRCKWVANIKHPDGKQMHLGYFATEQDAHVAYINAKRDLHEGNTL